MENLLIQLFSTSIVHFEGNNFSPKYAFQFCLRKIQSFDSMFMYCTDQGLQLGDRAPLNSLSLWKLLIFYIMIGQHVKG